MSSIAPLQNYVYQPAFRDSLTQPSLYSNDPAVSTNSPEKIDIIYKVHYHKSESCVKCFDCIDKRRKYDLILENSIERNNPTSCCCLPPNCCCPGEDHIIKTYYDRGPWDMQACAWKSGCVSGTPTPFPNSRIIVCCCKDCCVCWNDYSECYITECCGDRIRMTPGDYWCWCCPNRACWIHNWCGLCGLKSGQPLYLYPLIDCLKAGTGETAASALFYTRALWSARVGKK